MNMILILINREFLRVKNSLIIYLSIMFFSPLFLYLFLSIPLSLIIEMKPIYLNWSSAGIWLVSTMYLSYLISFYNIKQIFNSESFLSLPILSWQIITSHYIFISIISVIQLLISVLLLNAINNDFLSFRNYFVLIIITIPSVIIISNIAFLVFMLFVNKIFLSFVHVFILLVLAFGYGSFIPINYFPQSYYKIVSYFPLSGTVLNYQKLLTNEDIMFSFFLISLFFSIVLFLLILFLCERKMKNY